MLCIIRPYRCTDPSLLAPIPLVPKLGWDVRYGSLADIGARDQRCPLYPQKQTFSAS